MSAKQTLILSRDTQCHMTTQLPRLRTFRLVYTVHTWTASTRMTYCKPGSYMVIKQSNFIKTSVARDKWDEQKLASSQFPVNDTAWKSSIGNHRASNLWYFINRGQHRSNVRYASRLPHAGVQYCTLYRDEWVYYRSVVGKTWSNQAKPVKTWQNYKTWPAAHFQVARMSTTKFILDFLDYQWEILTEFHYILFQP